MGLELEKTVEDSVMIEVVDGKYDATEYPKYRDVVKASIA